MKAFAVCATIYFITQAVYGQPNDWQYFSSEIIIDCDTNQLNSMFGLPGENNSTNTHVNDEILVNYILEENVINNCDGAVNILLENGANPNAISQSGHSMCTLNYLNIRDALEMTNVISQANALARARNIRTMLVARGGALDRSQYLRRNFIDSFAGFMMPLTGQVVFVYCDNVQIKAVEGGAELNTFEVPEHPLELNAWIESTFSAIDLWIKGSDWNNKLVAIIGAEDINWTTLNRVCMVFENNGIKCEKYSIPSYISCSPSILVGIYMANPDDPSTMLKNLNQECTSEPIPPNQISDQEYMAL